MQTENEFYRELDKDQDANLVEVEEGPDITDLDRARLIKERDISDIIEMGNPSRIEKLIRCYFDVLACKFEGDVDWFKAEIANEIISAAYNITFSDFQDELKNS
jgi:hypothetical protein